MGACGKRAQAIPALEDCRPPSITELRGGLLNERTQIEVPVDREATVADWVVPVGVKPRGQ